jgi:hypothetical protein
VAAIPTSQHYHLRDLLNLNL